MPTAYENHKENTFYFQFLPFSGPTSAKMALSGSRMPQKNVVQVVQPTSCFKNDDKKCARIVRAAYARADKKKP